MCCCRLRIRPRSAVQTRNHVVLTCDSASLGNDADCGSRDRLRHFRLQSPAEVHSCQLYRSFVDECDVCRPRRAAADGSPTPPRSNGTLMMAELDGCDVIKTVTSSSTGNCAVECPECLVESGRTLHSSPVGPLASSPVGPLATDGRLPRSTVTV